MDDFEHDAKTIVDRSSAHALADVIPGAPPVAPLEVVFDRETFPPGTSPPPDRPYRALEIWTQNRVYVVDSTLTCIEVLDRKTGRQEQKHSVLGARLTGGQRQYGKTVHLARPFPVPGTEAVFESPERRRVAGLTTKVERVVLRLQVTSFVTDASGAWDDVTSALLHPSFGAPRR